jgi:hypothetical protein
LVTESSRLIPPVRRADVKLGHASDCKAVPRALFDAKLEQGLAELKAELVKWMFLFWLGTVATMLGPGRVLLGA